MNEPNIDNVERALDICRRADEIYEMMRSRRYPDTPRDHALPNEIAQRMRIQSLVIALVEVQS